MVSDEYVLTMQVVNDVLNKLKVPQNDNCG